MYDLINVAGETETPQRSKNLQSFWFWVKENFLYTLNWIKTWWEFQTNIFYLYKCGRFGSLVLSWHSEPSVSICFQEGFCPKRSCCKWHSYLGTFIDTQWNFYFSERWLCKNRKSKQVPLLWNISTAPLLLDSPIQTLPKKVVESHVSQQAVLHMAR